MLDSYENFLSEFKISIDQFLDFGIKSVIYIPDDKAKENWNYLKNRINNDGEVFIRGFGRDAKGTPLLLDFYKHLLGNSHIKKDPTNNSQPTKMIKELSGYSKVKSSTSIFIESCPIYTKSCNISSISIKFPIIIEILILVFKLQKVSMHVQIFTIIIIIDVYHIG